MIFWLKEFEVLKDFCLGQIGVYSTNEIFINAFVLCKCLFLLTYKAFIGFVSFKFKDIKLFRLGVIPQSLSLFYLSHWVLTEVVLGSDIQTVLQFKKKKKLTG